MQATQSLPPAQPVDEEELNDLELAEINYLCIEASLQESTQSARQNTFEYCMDHLKDLFEQEEYLQAVQTSFVTQSSSYSW